MKCPRCGTEFYGDKCPKCGYEPTDYDISLDTLMRITGVGRRRAEELYKAGYRDIESIARSKEEDLARVRTIGPELAKRIRNEARKFVEEEPEEFVRICHVCGAIIPPGADRCPRCGAPVSQGAEEEEEGELEEETTLESRAICPFCGALIPRDAKTCPVCGANVENVPLEEPRPMEDPSEVLKRFFGVSEIPKVVEEEEESADIRVCPNCGAIVVNRDTCPFCGTPLPKVEPKPLREEEIDLSERLSVCPNCGAFVSPDAKVCHICGAEIGEREEEEMGISMADLLRGGVGAAAMEEAGEAVEPMLETGGGMEEDSTAATAEENQDVISLEDLEDIERSLTPEMEEIEGLAEEITEAQVPEEPGEEIATEDLREIEKILEEEKVSEALEEPIPERKKVVPPPKELPEERKGEVPIEEPGFWEKINEFIMNFGTAEDILSFSPLLVLLIFILSAGAMSGDVLRVFEGTTAMFMGALALVLGLNAYRTFKGFSRKEIIYGLAISLSPAVTLLPYGLYLSIGAMILIALFRLRQSFDYWIPYAALSAFSALYISSAQPLAFIAAGLFSAHLIARYGEMGIRVRHEESLSVGKLYEMGMEAFSDRRYYDAIYYLRRVLKQRPNDVNVMNTLGLAYGRIGNTDMAIEMFRRALSINPNYKVAWNNLGNVYARMEDYDEAMKCYRRALQIDPDYEDALLNMGYVMIRRGKYGEAMRIAEKMKATSQT